MSGNVRDPNMKRINSRELADAFIEEQIKEIKKIPPNLYIMECVSI